MLTTEHRKYIRRNYRDMSVYAMAKNLGVCKNTVRSFMLQAGLTPKKTKSEIRKETGYACNPPESCFNCPYEDCIAPYKGNNNGKRNYS